MNHEASVPTAPIHATAPASTQESGETAPAPSTATTHATQITPETASAPSESGSSPAGGHATAPNEGTTHSESSGTGSVSNAPSADGTDTLGRSDSAPTSTNGQESGSAPAQAAVVLRVLLLPIRRALRLNLHRLRVLRQPMLRHWHPLLIRAVPSLWQLRKQFRQRRWQFRVWYFCICSRIFRQYRFFQ